MIYRLLRSLAELASGLDCRRCGEDIPRADEFGLAEGVCRGCRVEL